jgi:hypothetical protein
MTEKVQEKVERYEAPTVVTLGTLQELTQFVKCSGSADQFLPTLVKPLAPGRICS